MKEILDQVRDNLDEIFGKYDEASRELLRIARLDGHFADWDPSEVAWPEHPADVTGLEKRDRLITTIYEGIPSRRDSRLAEAYDGYRHAMGPYLGANCIFLDVQRQFLSRGAGDESEFLQLYQTVYLEALGRDDQIPLDAGEAALVEFRVARAPLSHAQSVAEKIQTQAAADDPRWSGLYSYSVDGDGETKTAGAEQATLREALTLVAESVVDALAKGEHLAIRYNTFSNFIWFGISVWKVVSDVDLLVTRLRGSVRGRWLDKLETHVRLAQALLLKFLEAHLEDPAQIRPKDYWFGQQYSYLTRDMIDLVRGLVAGATKLSRRARGNGQELPVIEIPPLLCGQAVGRFVEYPSPVGARGLPPTPWQQRARALGWVRIFRQRAQRTRRLRDAGLEEAERLAAAWRNADDWGRRTLDLFGIQLEVRIDPQFERLASRLVLSASGRKIVFFPTHQSLLDHPVMYRVLHSPELMRAMGWENPVPCVLLSRVGLTTPTEIKVGSRKIPLIGVDSATADRLMEEVDGYVMLEHSSDTGSPTARFAKLLEKRPGVVYGAGTTAAFDIQILPMQHALFAHLPQDIVLIPVAFRGIHALWPKSPKGNFRISPGRVEVIVSPPMLGETTLLPRKRALRTQLEPATFFQAVHIATLLNPEPSDSG